MTGRPTKFTHSLADIICERIADGESLRSICRDDAMPAKSTVLAWLADDDKTSFRTKYAQAREIQADGFVDEMVEIADDGTNDWMEKKNADGEATGWQENGEAIRRSQLRIGTRQWIAEKLKPKKYGTKVELEHGVSGEVSQLLEAINGKTRGLPNGN
ncbi:terminase small subunit-like protein [Rhizobium ruizarguesonis]|uniref:terminase small subunit-like protein n=1 Tax=Rhizobium ruizarguesonis TaxID=2081791 RepID=UPI001032064E|nr:terminase small subunit protein [Rhizobium ruizarguesonis]TBA65353.1 terminase small subunit protein [Rhizobium ruizarguesonis]